MHWKLSRLKDKIIFSLEFKWIKSSNGEKVTGAIQGGCKHGEMYIGRAFHVADLIPGKFPCSHDVLYLPWGGKEYYKKEYEILVSDEKARYAWIPSPSGQIPQEAIPGKGPSINDVGPFFRIYDPPPSPCRLRLLNRLM